jgi:membrane associated rhomboid family serine protease
VPAIVVALLVVLGLVHALLSVVLTPGQTTEFLLLFAFIPARYDASVLPDIVWPGGWAADIWTFVTYALIHGDLTHLVFNAVWLLAFGSPVARRFGPLRFLAFMAVTAAAGAAVHLATHFGELLPMIGASAAISGAMAAATRFAFQRGGPLGLWRGKRVVGARGTNLWGIGPFRRSFAEFRVEIYQEKSLTEMTIFIEPSPGEDGAALTHRVAAALQYAFGLRIAVSAAAAGTLPRFEAKSKRWIYL